MVAGRTARADFINFTGSDVSGRAASVVFSTNGSGNLTVTLTNTSGADALAPTDVLTAVFFNIAGNPTLSRVSAVLSPGSSVINPLSGTGTDPGGVVGGEWAFSALGGPRDYGISSSGFSLFGPPDLFPGNDLAPPVSPDGVQYGITTAGDNPATGNGGISEPLIKNSVTFTLSGLSSSFLVNGGIGSVRFQYGTGINEPSTTGTPTPPPNEGPGVAPLPSVASVGMLLIGTLGLRRKKAIRLA